MDGASACEAMGDFAREHSRAGQDGGARMARSRVPPIDVAQDWNDAPAIADAILGELASQIFPRWGTPERHVGRSISPRARSATLRRRFDRGDVFVITAALVE